MDYRAVHALHGGQQSSTIDRARLAAFALNQLNAAGTAGSGAAPEQVALDVQPLRGGLDATAVVRVDARLDAAGQAGSGCARRATFVVKRLEGAQRREADVYRVLLEPHAPGAAPALLGVEAVGPTSSYLYLEHARAARAWPWRDVDASALVLERLAALHASLPVAACAASGASWDYEAELRQSAASTLELFERVARHESLAALRRGGRWLRRMVAALPDVRRTLLGARPFGAAVLHGDAHSGNAVISAGGAGERAVLLDWGRARLGSPLEDVASWLQSLGYWEPVARQRHDTLLRRYLRARGLPTHLGREVRDAYWLAAACNVLAGALRYHLYLADGWGAPPSHGRADAVRAAHDHLRVLRRADTVWRS